MIAFRLIRNRLRSRSLSYTFIRFANIVKHYGFTATPFNQVLEQFVESLVSRGLRPTFPVTAIVVHRHPELFKKLQDMGVEFAIHGYRHIDYTQLSSGRMRYHLDRAIDIFRRAGIRHRGFRFPFLRRNPDCTRIVNEYSFLWESSEVISWPLPVSLKVSVTRCDDYAALVESYQALESRAFSSVPYRYQGGLQIPVSIPDDDLLIERLGLPETQIHPIWDDILSQCRLRGEVFVMQLHPERFFMFRSALNTLLERAMAEDVWIASLEEVAEWWTQRSQAKVKVTALKKGFWRAVTDLPLLTRAPGPDGFPWQWQPFNAATGCVESAEKPVIGLVPPVSQEVIDFLIQEGYLFEYTRDYRAYPVWIHGESVSLRDISQFKEKIENMEKPLLKISRWPAKYQSALALTGDIDGIDFWDYWTRFYGT